MIGLGMDRAAANETRYSETTSCESAGDFAADGTSSAHDEDGRRGASKEESCAEYPIGGQSWQQIELRFQLGNTYPGA